MTDFWNQPICTTIKGIIISNIEMAQNVCVASQNLQCQRATKRPKLKIQKAMPSLDFEYQSFNCRNKNICLFRGKCRQRMVVCQDSCTATGKRCISNTQQPVKRRMQQHVHDAESPTATGKLSDSFTDHFAKPIPKNTPKAEITKNINFSMKIPWKGNPLSSTKTFGLRWCKLCSKERLEMLKMLRNDWGEAIKKCIDIRSQSALMSPVWRWRHQHSKWTKTQQFDDCQDLGAPSSSLMDTEELPQKSLTPTPTGGSHKECPVQKFNWSLDSLGSKFRIDFP